jgi:2-dehydropantoate 2-reductase
LRPSISPTLNILTFGAGAIGTYIGGSLALAGHSVVFIEQPKVVQQLRERGLHLDLTLDRRRKTKDPTILSPSSFFVLDSLKSALTHGPFQVALFALKSYDTSVALEQMEPFARDLPPVFCLSNGVDNEPAIAGLLGVDKVIAGTVTSAISRRAAGDILLEKLRGVGVAAGHDLSETLAAAMNSANLKARLYRDSASMKWSKMLTNLMANPTSAILDMTPAEVFAHPGLYKLEINMLKECLAVMKAQRLDAVDLPGTPVRALALAALLPLWFSNMVLARAAGTGRGGKMPSFHIDLHSGRGRSEVNYLHGAVVRAGIKYDIPTPVNKLLTETLLAMTRGEIPLEEYSHQPEKLLQKI